MSQWVLTDLTLQWLHARELTLRLSRTRYAMFTSHTHTRETLARFVACSRFHVSLVTNSPCCIGHALFLYSPTRGHQPVTCHLKFALVTKTVLHVLLSRAHFVTFQWWKILDKFVTNTWSHYIVAHKKRSHTLTANISWYATLVCLYNQKLWLQTLQT